MARRVTRLNFENAEERETWERRKNKKSLTTSRNHRRQVVAV
jgi:hypothetical protein